MFSTEHRKAFKRQLAKLLPRLCKALKIQETMASCQQPLNNSKYDKTSIMPKIGCSTNLYQQKRASVPAGRIMPIEIIAKPEIMMNCRTN
jgi:hypothetical protein